MSEKITPSLRCLRRLHQARAILILAKEAGTLRDRDSQIFPGLDAHSNVVACIKLLNDAILIQERSI